MPSPALAVYQRLADQIAAVRKTATQTAAAGDAEASSGCLRSCIVLTVAALDSYMHEQGVRLLEQRAALGGADATAVASYLGGIADADVQGPSANGLIRLRLSYKTLVAAEKIDDLLTACGLDPTTVWMKVAIGVGSRPDRLRRLLQLQVDRRNQIAHEGDWDPAAVDLRQVTDSHADDCSSCIDPVIVNFDVELP